VTADLVVRLRETLDEAYEQARIHSDSFSHLICRLVERDRALLDAFAEAEAAYNDQTTQLSEGIRLPRYHRMATLRAEVERAAEFWLGPEVADGDH
jgi:predicted CopG family antitoxin